MKSFLFLVIFLVLSSVASAQTVAKNVQKAADGTNAITESLTFGSGKTLTLSGVLAGTPTSGTLDLSALTLTLPTAPTFSGTWTGAQGGTGVANTGKTITLGGNFATSGAYALTLTLSGATGVTLPTTGTLATIAGSETLTNKTLTSPTLTTPNIGAATGTSLAVSGNITSSAGNLTVSGTGAQALGGTGATVSIAGTSAIKGIRTATATKDFGTINAGASGFLTFTITGAVVGDTVIINPTDGGAVDDGLEWSATISAANTAYLRLFNPTAGNIVVGSRTYRATVISF